MTLPFSENFRPHVILSDSYTQNIPKNGRQLLKISLTAETPVKRLDRNGVKGFSTGERLIRAVTHYHIRPSDIETVIKVFNTVLYQE